MANTPLSAFRRIIKRIAVRFRRDPVEGAGHLSGIVFVTLIAAATIYATVAQRPAQAPSAVPDPIRIGGAFQLEGPNGEPVSDRSFPDKWLLVFFGYTFCPDICPTTLADIANAMDALGPLASRVQPLFITIDPKRDTPAVLKEYTAHFDARILGLTGSNAQIVAVESAYKVYAAERPPEDGKGPVLFDHSGVIYLMKPSGAFATNFNAGLPGRDLARGIKAAIEEDPGA
jgi:protein SCO1/2